MKANRIFKVLYKLHFWLRLCSRRPGSEPGYLRNILHIRYRNSLLFHHSECPRATFYLGTFRGYTWSCSVTVPLKSWDFKVISVPQRHEDIHSAQILLTAKSNGSFSMDPSKREKHQTKHTDINMLCKLLENKNVVLSSNHFLVFRNPVKWKLFYWCDLWWGNRAQQCEMAVMGHSDLSSGKEKAPYFLRYLFNTFLWLGLHFIKRIVAILAIFPRPYNNNNNN